MDIKTWYESNFNWLCERWDHLWNVKLNKPDGKLNDAHWIDNKEYDNDK